MINNLLKEAILAYSAEVTENEMYHNTEHLLKLYRKVRWRIESTLNDVELELIESADKNISELIDSIVDIDPRINHRRLKSRLSSIEDSKCILEIINLALAKLKMYPENGDKYYDLLNRLYICKTVRTVECLCETYNVSRSTFYREKNKAIKLFSIILWGFLIIEEK